MGALEDGRKQLLAVHDGFRESELSWQELLEDLKGQGLELPPKLAVGDGAMGFWAALRKVYPATREQRCWLHKTANVLNKLPQSMQGKAKQALRDIYLAESRQTAEDALDRFKNLYEKKFPKAVECPEKTAKCCWLSTTFRPSTGGTCGRRTRSNPPLRRSDCGSDERRVAAAGRHR